MVCRLRSNGNRTPNNRSANGSGSTDSNTLRKLLYSYPRCERSDDHRDRQTRTRGIRRASVRRDSQDGRAHHVGELD